MAYLPGQQYVQNAAGVWTPVGYAAGNALLPVNISSSAGNQVAVNQLLSVVGADNQGTVNITSDTGHAVAAVAMAGNVTFHVLGTAFVGSLVWEASLNGGANYAPIAAIREDGQSDTIPSGAAFNITGATIRTYTVGIAGFTHFRVRATAVTSGSVGIYITQGPFLIETNPSLAASNSLVGQVAPADGTKASYTAGIANFANAVAGDLVAVTGSASKVVRITRVDISSTATAATGTNITLQRRTTANTGGTAAGMTVGKLDTTDATPVAAATAYTAAPTTGTLASIVRAARLMTGPATAIPQVLTFDFGNRPSKAPVLRGIAEQFCINTSAAIAGATWSVSVEWTEE